MVENLIEKQNLLQDRAQSLIETLRLNELLGKYGEYYLTGSVSYGTMLQRDIDFKLKLSNHNSSTLFELARELFDTESVYVVHVHNITGFRGMEGYSIKASLTDVYAEKWNIDIMVEKTRFETDKEFNKNMQSISEKDRAAILAIKVAVFEEGKSYRDLSPTIYKAVIEEEIATPEEFEKYLEKIGKKVSDFEKSS